jgi:putative redox protein
MPGTDDSHWEGVVVRETGRGKFQVEVRAAGASLIADEPADVGGLGSGPNPYDLLGAALGACTVMTLRLYAGRKQWPLTAVSVRVLHRSQGLEGKDRFAREIVLEGDLSAPQRQHLVDIANRCPVHETLTRGAEIITVLAEPPVSGGLAHAPTGHMNDMLAACAD